MAELQSYLGNCHCGRFRFELSVPQIKTAISCPCSLCKKKDYLWLTPADDSFKVVRDDGNLVEYPSSYVHDKFCKHCGTGVLGEHLDGPLHGRLAVNVRTIQGVNPFEVEVTTINAETEDAKPRKLIAPTSAAQHIFSCHCGAVQAELLAPLDTLEVKEDNCSICVRNAYIGVYPTKDQVRIHGDDNTFEYRRPPGYSGISHCQTCGVTVFSNIYGPPISIFDKLPAERKQRALAVYAKNIALKPLNVRTIEGTELASITVKRTDEGTEGYSIDA